MTEKTIRQADGQTDARHSDPQFSTTKSRRYKKLLHSKVDRLVNKLTFIFEILVAVSPYT